MKTLVGTTGAIAIALFLAVAPSAAAEGIPLQPAQPVGAAPIGNGTQTGSGNSKTEGGISLGSGDVGSSGDTGSGETGSGLGSGSGQTGSAGSGSAGSGSGVSLPIATTNQSGSSQGGFTGGTASAG
ncbi:hypothetical protein AB0N05_16530 [Nocardia sp. NPDC051030]|uniref:hypothetical protein n=1 Tax=Nocardia sp. NPDC051030 TaxID=3155162 RepID=UPI00341AB8E4